MRKVTFISLFLLVGVIGINTVLVAQETSKNFNTKQNSLELLLPYYNFMDGSQKIPVLPLILNLKNLGIQYNRFSPTFKWALNISASYLLIEYYNWYKSGLMNLKIGDIILRENLYISGSYFRNLLKTRFGSTYGGSGINIRLGVEETHIGYYGWEEISNPKPLRDVGINLSLKEVINVPYNFSLTGQISYTIYLYHYYNAIGAPPFDGGSTKNLITYLIGIGYRF